MEDVNSAVLDRRKPQNLHRQLLEILKGPIEQGDWKVGARIPSEAQLRGLYQVSKTTVRQAIEELVSFGYLSKVQGRATFVRRRIPGQSRRMAIHLNAEWEEFDSPRQCYVVEEAIARPDLEIADRLGIGGTEACWLLTRIQVLGGLALALETLALPRSSCVGEQEEQIFYKPGDQPFGFAQTLRRMDRYERILEFERL